MYTKEKILQNRKYYVEKKISNIWLGWVFQNLEYICTIFWEFTIKLLGSSKFGMWIGYSELFIFRYVAKNALKF